MIKWFSGMSVLLASILVVGCALDAGEPGLEEPGPEPESVSAVEQELPGDDAPGRGGCMADCMDTCAGTSTKNCQKACTAACFGSNVKLPYSSNGASAVCQGGCAVWFLGCSVSAFAIVPGLCNVIRKDCSTRC